MIKVKSSTCDARTHNIAERIKRVMKIEDALSSCALDLNYDHSLLLRLRNS